MNGAAEMQGSSGCSRVFAAPCVARSGSGRYFVHEARCRLARILIPNCVILGPGERVHLLTRCVTARFLGACLVASVPGCHQAAAPRPSDFEVCDTTGGRPTELVASFPKEGRIVADSATLIGVVVDRTTGRAVPEAVVRAIGPTRRVTATDSAGGFRIGPILPGQYHVTSVRLAYRGGDTTVTLVGGQNFRVRLALQFEACGLPPRS
jgi:Carboxypeptidase regulatory-like domain